MLHTGEVPDDPESPLIYRERLLPGPSWWILAASLVAMVAIAYGAALGAPIGFATGLGLGLIALIALIRSSPMVEVHPDRIACGRACIPTLQVGEPTTVQRDRITAIRRGHEAGVGDRVYVVLPAWMARSAVLLPVTDPDDPHSAWLVATRRPDGLIAALAEAGSTR